MSGRLRASRVLMFMLSTVVEGVSGVSGEKCIECGEQGERVRVGVSVFVGGWIMDVDGRWGVCGGVGRI